MDPISAGIAVGGSLLNGLMQGSQNRANRKWQSKENQKARDYNTEMWEKITHIMTLLNKWQG